MKVIPFPNAAQRKNAIKSGTLFIEKIDVTQNQTMFGKHTFTCVDCGQQHSFEASNIIFKVLEFFCAKCGSLYKVTNPMLKILPSREPDPQTKPKRNRQ
jgi:acetone carboxylase gamma subunit